MVPILDIDELCGDAKARARLSNTPLENRGNVELVANRAKVDTTTLVRKRRRAAGDAQSVELCQCVDDLFGNAVGEIFIGGITAHVREGEDGHRSTLVRRR